MEKVLFARPLPYKFEKNPHTDKFCMVAPHSEQEIPLNVPVLLCKNTNEDLVLLDDRGRVRSQITSV